MLNFANLAKAVGSDYLGDRVRKLHPAAHVFGHTHFAWDTELDGTRYIQWPLGYPRRYVTELLTSSKTWLLHVFITFQATDCHSWVLHLPRWVQIGQQLDLLQCCAGSRQRLGDAESSWQAQQGRWSQHACCITWQLSAKAPCLPVLACRPFRTKGSVWSGEQCPYVQLGLGGSMSPS